MMRATCVQRRVRVMRARGCGCCCSCSCCSRRAIGSESVRENEAGEAAVCGGSRGLRVDAGAVKKKVEGPAETRHGHEVSVAACRCMRHASHTRVSHVTHTCVTCRTRMIIESQHSRLGARGGCACVVRGEIMVACRMTMLGLREE